MTATAASTHASPGLTLTADTPWIVPPDQPEPLQRALEDIKRDWYKVLGHLPVILPAPPLGWNGPLVYFGLNAQASLTEGVMPPAGRESFVLALGLSSDGRSVVLATGADLRGHLAALRGEPTPPVRPRRSYEHICRYQERFLANFPLLYGSPPTTPTAAHSGV